MRHFMNVGVWCCEPWRGALRLLAGQISKEAKNDRKTEPSASESRALHGLPIVFMHLLAKTAAATMFKHSATHLCV